MLFARSVLLARWLPVEVFGIYALAGAVVGLTATVPNFGMGGAFLHRSAETEDEEQAASVHFTLKLIFTVVWATVLVTGTFVFTSGQTCTALVLLTVTTGGLQLVQTPQLILTRRVLHRRLALIQLFDAVLTTLVALGFAWRGATLWALLVMDLVTLTVISTALYAWRPVWRPRLAWSPHVVRYFLRFGSHNFAAVTLLRALNRLDDLWTGLYLGKTPLGFYSRAYKFATYPRAILAAPINMVARGTFAELKRDRVRLSQAFFRTNAFLVRSGFFMSGVIVLVAPEFIRLALGSRWLPMLDAFRLMLVFMLVDPIMAAVSSLFVAVGRPDQVIKTRAVQLAILLIGLFLLGKPLGITGVALAVNGMAVVGMVILLWQARAYVDFSPRRLFATPSLAVAVGLVLSYVASAQPRFAGSDWWAGAVKMVAFSVAYGVLLLAFERRQFSDMLSLLTRHLFWTPAL